MIAPKDLLPSQNRFKMIFVLNIFSIWEKKKAVPLLLFSMGLKS